MRKILVGLLLTLLVVVGGGYLALRRGDIPYATLDKTYASPASKFIDMGGGVEAHWRDEGNPNGRPLLLVHGFSASLHTWEKWVPLLGGEYRLISVDLPGHGLTRTPEGYQPTIEGYADFVDAFMDKIALPKATVIGSSMGGHAAWELALRHPARVEGLVLIGAAGWPRSGDDSANKEAAIFKLLRNPVLGPVMRDLDNSAMVRKGIESAFVNKSLVDEAMLARYVDLARAPNHRATLVAITLGFRERDLATKEKLAVIAVPTLVLHGKQDNLVPVEGAALFGEAIKGSNVIIYDQIGHVPQEEVPARSADDLRAFLHAAFPEPAAGAPLAATLPQ
ncbi:MAG: alpha/beta hydrolase [Hyphomonadaceae bacterium]|nr:MAG: alpha/beta fold family hydrolase [Caulobacteraceae bacterium]MBT9444397.1 alpha/beta hydrolase [Hyphomonadaceae bacterium]TPW05646.1 MAG: alpha/beta fold family hydrolase [Alphaproteobacteria bacterium]